MYSSYLSHSFPFQISLKRMLQNPTQRMTALIPQAMTLRKTRCAFNCLLLHEMDKGSPTGSRYETHKTVWGKEGAKRLFQLRGMTVEKRRVSEK